MPTTHEHVYYVRTDGESWSNNITLRELQALKSDPLCRFLCKFEKVDGLGYEFPVVIVGNDSQPEFQDAKDYAQSELVWN